MDNKLDIRIWREQKRVNDLFQKVMGEALAIGIPISKHIDENIVINTRAKSRFGCCKRQRRDYGITPHTIEIAAKVLEAPEKSIKEILAHELLHTCDDCNNHHTLWKKYADEMNRKYGYNIKRTSSAFELGIPSADEVQNPIGFPERKPALGSLEDELRKEARFVLVCKKCGAKIERVRETKVVRNPELYRCKCGGELKRI